uniref:Elongation of very long chain fatty acids protein n=1 Tax=Nerita melanotragus TaxID=464123 RepID=A0A0M4FPS7_9GAST|nr:elongation of very long-chain fatty acid protein a [Nerita melanotragus]
MTFLTEAKDFYKDAMARADKRVEGWLLMGSPLPILMIFILYLLVVWLGPSLASRGRPMSLRAFIVPYNFALVGLSVYMFYEFLVTSVLSGYSYTCQPVDYSYAPLALRMAKVCWWFFFSKVIELLDTVFFILRHKWSQVTFLHVYHHCTMIINWWMGVKYVAGGQAFFTGMLNSGVHIMMYLYYGLAAVGPHMQKYLWWKRYLTRLQLMQFVAFVIHTGYNLTTDCEFPDGFNYAAFLYAISLLILFGNFYYQSYSSRRALHKKGQ